MPAEILRMDKRSLSMYKEALRTGKQKVYNIRVMVVGQYGVGKTTLTKRLLGQDVNILDQKSTEGIDVHMNSCKISLSTGEWTKQEKDTDQLFRLRRLVKLLNEHVQKQEASDGQDGHNRNYDYSAENDTTPSMSNRSGAKDTVIEILQLINKDTEKLKKEMEECAVLAVWDFAGQYVFYTTHQTFLTNRAIYLLVINLNQQITDLINDDEFFSDVGGIKLSTVYDMIETWLNSIHSCTPSKDSGIPAVILVGTHLDKIPENSRQKVKEYFKSIYEKLKTKPTLVHLVGHIAIDNTISDTNSQLEELKGLIFKVAKEQKFWGEERPALWIPLEQSIMTLKASGAKVVPLSLVEEINRSGSVTIDDKELHLFLRFQHEIGTILYFNVEGLKEKIMLDPQWIIDAQKSLITADEFMRGGKWYKLWCEFKDQGKLTHQLVDVIWSKENSPDFHDNKDYLLLLMETLNIIARPKSYSSDGEDVKVEDYFLAPCMLRETTPRAVISPEIQQHMKSSSVLCFAFVEMFLPPPIFHRLLAACVAHWPIAKDKNKKDNLIYCGCCVFDLDLHHRLTVFFREHVILARVIRFGGKGEIPSARLCINVRKFIKMTLTNVIANLGQSLRFQHYILCPRSDGCNVNWLNRVKDLKKYEDIPCHCQDNSHIIKSRELLQSWFVDDDPQEKRSHHKTEEPACSTDDVAGIPGETLRKKHNVLLLKLHDEINVKDPGYKNFLTYLRNTFLPSGRLSAIEKEPLKVFELMEQRGRLKVGDYKVLEEALEQSGNHNLLELVRKLGSEIKWIKGQGLKMRGSRSTDAPLAKCSTKSNITYELTNPFKKWPNKLLTKPSQGNLKAQFDRTDTVYNQRLLVNLAKSIGIIKLPSACGTGFRVGRNYVMTAKHVIDGILKGGPVPFGQQKQPKHSLLRFPNICIDFSYELPNCPGDINSIFSFEEIVYENQELDVAILRLKSSDNAYPPPIINFNRLEQMDGDLYLIGHSKADIKKIDKFSCASLDSNLQQAAGYEGVNNPHCQLLHCTFEKGASGAPGVWICPNDDTPYIVLMLIKGYPDWYYDEKTPPEKKSAIIPHVHCVEQGVLMEAIYNEMMKVNSSLTSEIFHYKPAELPTPSYDDIEMKSQENR